MKHILRRLMVLFCCLFLLNACALAQTDGDAPVLPEATAAVEEILPSPTAAPETESTLVPEVTAAPDMTCTPGPTAAQEATCTPEPTAAPVHVVLGCTEAEIGYKDKGFRLEVSFSDGLMHESDGTPRSIRFVSSRSSRVSVNNEGVLQGKSTGSAVITVETDYGSAECSVTVLSAPTKVTLELGAEEIMVGETQAASAVFSRKQGGSYSYTSSDPDILAVDENGNYTGMSAGSAVLTLRSYNGKTSKKTVTVYALPESMDLPEAEVVLAEGMAYSFTPVFPELTRAAYSFASDAPEIAGITPEGTLSAVSAGTAVISVQSENGLQDSCIVKVLPAPASFEVAADAWKMGVGEKLDLKPLLQLSEGSMTAFRYESSKSKYAPVDENGIVTAKRTGKAVITATTHNGLSAQIEIQVLSAPSRVRLKPDALTLGVGQSMQLEPVFSSGFYGSCSYVSADAQVAEVDENGWVHARGVGKTEITVKTYNGKSRRCSVTVLSAPDTIGLSCTQAVMGIGEELQLSATRPEGTMCGFFYSSDRPEVLDVGSDGALSAMQPGVATITAVSHNGLSAACTIEVRPAPQHFALAQDEITLFVGQSYVPECAYEPQDAHHSLRLTTSEKKIVAIGENGELIAKRSGTATITVRTYNGLTAKLRVRVPKEPRSIEFNEGLVYLASGEEVQLGYALSEGAQTVVRFESSDPGIAEVDAETGIVRGVATGSAIIRASTLNGKADSCIVNINIDAAEEVKELLEVIFLEVGRNDGILLSCSGEYAFIDSGTRKAGKTSLEYLQELGVDHLKYYIATHAHMDHVGGAPVLLEGLDVDMVLMPHKKVKQQIQKFAETKDESDAVSEAVYQIIVRGDSFYLGEALIDCIGPVRVKNTQPHAGPENENSLVLRVSHGENSFLMTGDAPSETLWEIEQTEPGSLQADVHKNPHHNSTLKDYVLEAIDADITVISTSKDDPISKSYGQLLESLGSEIYTTSPDRDGCVTITSDGSTLSVTTEKN